MATLGPRSSAGAKHPFRCIKRGFCCIGELVDLFCLGAGAGAGTLLTRGAPTLRPVIDRESDVRICRAMLKLKKFAGRGAIAPFASFGTRPRRGVLFNGNSVGRRSQHLVAD